MSHPVVSKEIEQIRNHVQYESKMKGGWLDCFSLKDKILYRTLLGAYASLAHDPFAGRMILSGRLTVSLIYGCSERNLADRWFGV